MFPTIQSDMIKPGLFSKSVILSYFSKCNVFFIKEYI